MASPIAGMGSCLKASARSTRCTSIYLAWAVRPMICRGLNIKTQHPPPPVYAANPAYIHLLDFGRATGGSYGVNSIDLVSPALSLPGLRTISNHVTWGVRPICG